MYDTYAVAWEDGVWTNTKQLLAAEKQSLMLKSQVCMIESLLVELFANVVSRMCINVVLVH